MKYTQTYSDVQSPKNKKQNKEVVIFSLAALKAIVQKKFAICIWQMSARIHLRLR